MVRPSVEAISLLQKEGLSGFLVNARFAKPLDKELLIAIGTRIKFVFTVEEGVINGGFGTAVENVLARPVEKFGLPDTFISHGKRELLLERYGLTGRQIADKIKEKVVI